MVTAAEIKEAIKVGRTDMSVTAQSLDNVRTVCEVTSLTKLRISGSLTELPAEIGQLVNLETLSLENNKLRTLPEEFGLLRSLRTLYAYSNEIAELPDSFGDLSSLQSATLWSNQLSALPKTIGKLSSLVSLDLKRNPLSALPDGLAKLTNLKELDCGSCELSALPADLSAMAALTKVDLHENAFTAFPLGILSAPALMYLNLTGNQLSELPDDIDRLEHLRGLFLGAHYKNKNTVSVLPAGLFKLNKLEKLDLTGNQLTEVPRELSAMPALKQLNLKDNPLKGVPPEKAKQGMRAVFIHLGYAEPVKMPVPSDDEKKAAAKAYKDRLESFRRDARGKLHDDDKLADILAFLKGDQDEVPALTTKDHYSFNQIWEVLDTDGSWTWVCDRVLAVMAGDAWVWKRYNDMSNKEYDKGFHEDFCNWLSKAVPNEGEADLAGEAIRKLAELGVEDESDWARHLADECNGVALREDGSMTSVGRAILSLADAHLDEIMDAVKGRRGEGPIIELFMRHRPEAIEDRLDAVLFPEPKEGKKKHAPYDELERLSRINKERFEPTALRALAWTDCPECKMEVARVLVEQWGDAHAGTALSVAKETFSYISEKKNAAERGFDFPWSGGKRWSDGSAEFADWALGRFGEALAEAVENYVENTKVMQLGVVEAAAKHLGQRALPMVGEALEMHLDGDMSKHFRRVFGLLSDLDGSSIHDAVWELVVADNESARSQAAAYLARQGPEVVSRAAELLKDKDAAARDGATRLLQAVDGGDARAAIAGAVDSEKNEDVRDLMVHALYGGGGPCSLDEVRRRVAVGAKRGKLKRPVAKWLDDKAFPELRWTGGDALSDEEVRWLLYRQSRVKGIDIDPEAAGAFLLIDRKTSGDFALDLIERALDKGGAVAKNRFALSTGGRLGDARAVKPLLDEGIGRRRLPAVQALGLLDNDDAARGLQQVAAAFSTKYKNIGDLAESAFNDLAVAQGLSAYELSDKLLDPLGFTNDLDRPFDIDGEAWRLRVLPSLKLGFVKPDGKEQKSPPKSVKKPHKDEIKEVQKQVRALGKQQTEALEAYLVSRRRWTSGEWSAYFGGHAVMRALAQRLLFGVFQGDKLREAFLVDETLAVPAGRIGLVHALDLDDAQRDAWAQTLSKKKIAPPFAQVDRLVSVPDAEHAADGFLWTFEDRQVYAGTFKRRADKRGWRRGSVVDGGEIATYRKVFVGDESGDNDVEVFVKLSGLNVQSWADTESQISLHGVFFVKPDSVECGSYQYDEPRWDTDPRLIKLGDVPAFAYSEALLDLSMMAPSDDDD